MPGGCRAEPILPCFPHLSSHRTLHWGHYHWAGHDHVPLLTSGPPPRAIAELAEADDAALLEEMASRVALP